MTVKQQLRNLHTEFHQLNSRVDSERMDEIEWEFDSLVRDDVFVYKGINVYIDDVSLGDDEVVIISTEGDEIIDGNTYTSLNVDQFIDECS